MEDPNEELHRQVPPKWVDDDQPSYQAFCPMPKDKGELSVSAGSLVSAQESHERFVDRGFSSWGVLSVTVDECSAQSLSAHYDPLGEDDESGPDDAHAVVDFNGLDSRTQQNKRGKALLAVSIKRGWTFRASDAS
jgi:hypothetical protein